MFYIPSTFNRAATDVNHLHIILGTLACFTVNIQNKNYNEILELNYAIEAPQMT